MQRTTLLAFDFGCLTHLGNFKLSTIVALVIFALGPGSQPLASADIIIASPSGLGPGDTFRIAFVTGGSYDATSTSITTYNNDVNADAQAQAGGAGQHVTYNGTDLTFSAIASTATEAAIDNIGQTGSPVYLVDGTEVASTDTVAGLWSGTIAHNLNETLAGFASFGEYWTGTNPDGTANSQPLGSSNPIVGFSSNTSFAWIYVVAYPNYFGLPLYAISRDLTVPVTVAPAPSAIVSWLTVAGCGAVIACVRRRRAAQRGF